MGRISPVPRAQVFRVSITSDLQDCIVASEQSGPLYHVKLPPSDVLEQMLDAL